MMKSKALIELHEGRRLEPYQDSLGYWTIGVGHLTGAVEHPPITDEECDELLELDLQKAKNALDKEMPWASKGLGEVRYAVLLDMVFNMGSLRGWPVFKTQVKDARYKAAAENMRTTLWASQVKTRAARLATMMETGEWPPELRNL